MPLSYLWPRGRTHTHTRIYVFADKSDYKKPGMHRRTPDLKISTIQHSTMDITNILVTIHNYYMNGNALP